MVTTPFPRSAAQLNSVRDCVKAEKNNFKFVEGLYNWIGNDVENRVLKKYNNYHNKSDLVILSIRLLAGACGWLSGNASS